MALSEKKDLCYGGQGGDKVTDPLVAACWSLIIVGANCMLGPAKPPGVIALDDLDHGANMAKYQHVTLKIKQFFLMFFYVLNYCEAYTKVIALFKAILHYALGLRFGKVYEQNTSQTRAFLPNA